MTKTAQPPDWQLVHVHPGAPPKPLEGAACNGCGLCCLLEPCPLGVLVSRRKSGACVALRWNESEQRYLCGMLSDPGGVTGFKHPWAVGVLATLARRAIAADLGCDAVFQAQQPEN